ncbi:MAG: hypothetical protein U9R75_07530, partial [Candidatus Thermoplasmatota archaeon]|nr:hypothetical protein [Candidatus Thermoplasmatota archaeon]
MDSFAKIETRNEGDPLKAHNKETDQGDRKKDLTGRPFNIIETISTPRETEISFPKDDISSKEALSFLGEIRDDLDRTGTAGLYFHNDMDGVNGGLFIRQMLREWFDPDLEIHASALDYKEIDKLKLDDNITYIFIDMDIDINKHNVFRIDHHGPERNLKKIDSRNFILTPPENDYEYPSTATALCCYLKHVSKGGTSSFFDHLNKGPWHQDQFTRILMLLASVCDNLWHLNFLIDIPIKRWIPDPEEEKYLILISISASITLGEEERKDRLVNDLFYSDVDPEKYLNSMCQNLASANNVMDFTTQISREAERFYNLIFFNLTDSVEQALKTLERDRETYRGLVDSMPLDMKGNREKMMELLSTKGDLE